MCAQRTAERTIVIADMGPGGSQRVIAALADDWVSSGQTVALITLSGRTPDEVSLHTQIQRIALGLTGPSTNPFSAIIANWHRMRALREAIRASGARQVVSFLAQTNILTILACRELDVYLVISERNDPGRQPVGFIWELLRKLFYRRADIVTANSMQAINKLSAYVPDEKLLLVPNPPPTWDDPPPAANTREKTLLAIGRLHRQKGYDLMLSVFAASKARHTGWRLVILGEGPQRAALEKQASELGISANVTLQGHERDVKSWLDRAAIFVQTSRYEGTSNALIEAISRGLPAIVSRTAGDGPYWVERFGCGTVIDSDNVLASAGALDDMIVHEAKRDELGAAGAKNLPKMFSSLSVQQAWEAALG